MRNIRTDRARAIGRAAGGKQPAISELCGQCGRGRAAIGTGGQVSPCVLGRFLVAGNVNHTPLGDILDGETWRQIVASVPPADACVTCTPADSNDCNPWSAPSPGAGSWELRDGPADPGAWLAATYSNQSLVTQAGPVHADHADPGDRPTGMPASSATMPSLIVQMFRHAMITDGVDVLDIGTGSGYGCAVLAGRLTDQHVTSVDIDEYLTRAATGRLDSIGLHPRCSPATRPAPCPGTMTASSPPSLSGPSQRAGSPRCGQAAGSSPPSPAPA